MSVIRAVVSTVVVGLSLLLGSCASPASEPGSESAGQTTTTATVPSHAPQVITGPAGTVSTVVWEPPARSTSAIRYLRIEDSAGKPVMEREYRTSPAELYETLAVGRYRIVSWVRDCGGSCEGKTDPQLAAPTHICGIRIEVKENADTTVTVDAPPDGDCVMTTNP